ncbi:MAG: gamma-glutamyltransferase, partial [Bacteroidota bacterium]
QPAIKLAKEGVVLNEFQQFDLNLLKDIFKKDKLYVESFYNGEEVKQIGDLIIMEDLADFLDAYGKEGADLFYKGEVGKTIAEDHKHGGIISRNDLEQFEVHLNKPFHFKYKHSDIYANNGPSAGGPIMAIILNKLANGKSISEAVCETANNKNKIPALIKALESILPNHNYSNAPGGMMSRGTSHFNIVDRWNNAISLTTSIGEGSGYFIKGTGIHMNNMLGEVGLLPNGLHSWLPNQRLGSMMTPTVVCRDHQPRLVLGSGGATRIPYMIAQVIHHFANGHSLMEAIDQSRSYYDGSVLHLESVIPNDKIPDAIQTRIWNKKTLYFGGVHAISVNGDQLESFGDPRRFGVPSFS